MRLFIAGACLLLAGQARAQGLDFEAANKLANEVDSEIATMQRDLDLVEKGYGEPITAEVTKVDRRLREGEIHFLLSDYLRASIVLLDVVEDEANKSHPRYDDCVFLLAESLRKSKNFSGAKQNYEEILDRATGDRLKDVVLGLLEISNATNRYDDVDRYIGRLRQAGTLSRPDVDYIYGKMLFRSSSDDPTQTQRALDVFRGVPAGSSVSGPASYYAGVTLVRLGRYEDALNQFHDTLAKAKTDQTLTELTHLSLGRLYQELGQVSKSTDAYQEISQNSPYFSDMLYEVAWAHVAAANKETEEEGRNKSFLRALQALELLQAAAPASRLYPEARILQGNLQIRLGAPETAYDTFQTIVDRFGGARDKLAELRTRGDPKEFFNELMERDLDAVMATSILPPLAVTWALEENDMGRAVAMQTDLRTSDKYMKESRELVEMLGDALIGEQKYRMIPGLSRARAKALSVENRLIVVDDTLRSIERRALYDYMSEGDRARLLEIAARADQLQKEIEGLPLTETDVEANREKIKEQYLETSRNAYRLTYRVGTMRAQLIAVEIWLGQNRDHLAPEEVKLTEERLKTSQAEVELLEAELDELQAEIRRATLVAESDAGRTRAMRMKDELDSVIGEEVSILRERRANAPSELQGLFARIEQQRQSLRQIGGDLSRLQASLDAQVKERVDEIRKEIAVEVNRLAQYQVEHGTLTGETDSLLGPVASRTLDSVSQQFRDLVLRADVGIIDVAWARKQAETDKVNTLIKEQRERTQELEEEFADVLKD
jgi:tetratricopeptide (TPR) repeat protein